MIVTAHEIGLESLDVLTEVDALCLFIGEDERPLQGAAGFLDWRLAGGLSRILKQGFFVGTAKDCLLLPTDGRVSIPRAFAIGVGRRDQLTAESLSELLLAAAGILSRAKVQAVALELPGQGSVEDAVRGTALRRQFLPVFGGKRVAVLSEPELMKHLPLDRKA